MSGRLTDIASLAASARKAVDHTRTQRQWSNILAPEKIGNASSRLVVNDEFFVRNEFGENGEKVLFDFRTVLSEVEEANVNFLFFWSKWSAWVGERG